MKRCVNAFGPFGEAEGARIRIRRAGVDWSVASKNRFAWVGSPPNPVPHPESLAELVREVRSPTEATLLGIDVGLGVPEDVGRRWGVAQGFMEWVRTGPSMQERRSPDAERWSPDRPFFRVPAGKGALAAFRRRATLLRRCDTLTGAKSVFLLSGVPGAVGGQCASVWEEIRTGLPHTSVWPFDGSLESLLRPGRVILLEVYPSWAARQLRGRLPPELRRAGSPSEARGHLLRALQAAPHVVRQGEASPHAFDAWIAWWMLHQPWAPQDESVLDQRYEGAMWNPRLGTFWPRS
ncbi:MAG: hypothetical protein ACFB9M_07380 [Myxococcota bacterium]